MLALCLGVACGGEVVDGKVGVPGREGRVKSAASVRALRRAFDGAPPVVPHPAFEADCLACHGGKGVEVPGLGFSPPMPHGATAGLSRVSRCEQCHVFRRAEGLFVGSEFVGLAQEVRGREPVKGYAPPVIPHRVFMRENCLACHAGPAAREEIRCLHVEREHCGQCHVPVVTGGVFERG